MKCVPVEVLLLIEMILTDIEVMWSVEPELKWAGRVLFAVSALRMIVPEACLWSTAVEPDPVGERPSGRNR